MSPEVVMSHVFVAAGILLTLIIFHIVYKLFVSDNVKKIGASEDGDGDGKKIDAGISKAFVFAYPALIVAFVLFEIWTGVIFTGPVSEPGKLDMGVVGKIEYTPSENSPASNSEKAKEKSLRLQKEGSDSFEEFKNRIVDSEREGRKDDVKPPVEKKDVE